MNIVRIHVDGFGKLHNFDLRLEEGVNLIIGANEAGKSTLHVFLRSMFYGADTKRRHSQAPVSESMRPWKYPGDFGGEIEVTDGGKRYLIRRNFDRAFDDLEVSEIRDKSKTLLSPEEAAAVMQSLLNGLSETAYVNTVSTGQLSSATERNMAGEVRRYAANVSTTASPELNADCAIVLLQEERKALEESLDQAAARDYAGLVSAAKKLEENLDRPDYENDILNIAASGRRAEAAAAEITGQLKLEEDTISSRRQILEASGLTGSDLIEQRRRQVREEYGKYRLLKERLEKKSGRLWSVLLIVGALLLAALAWKFRREYLFVILLISAAGCLAAALMVLYHRSSNEKTRQSLEGSLREQFMKYAGNAELSDDNYHRFDSRMQELGKVSEELTKATTNREALKAELERLDEEQKASRLSLDEQRETKTKVEDGLRELNSMHAEAAALRRRLGENNTIRDRIDAVDLAIETMEHLKEEVSNAVGTYINREASRMVEGLTGGVYTSVNAGRQYDISLNSHDGMIPISSVSAGTADQVYLALRLATIRFIAGEEDRVPLILDDSFALYDDDRLRKAVRFIAENYRGQVLIFSCQHREEEALKAEDLSFHLAKI